MPNTKKNATSLQVNDTATLSHDTAKSSQVFSIDTLTPDESLLVLIGLNGGKGYTITGDSIPGITDMTIKAMYHYTSLMESDGLTFLGLKPFYCFYNILLRIQSSFNDNGEPNKIFSEKSFTPDQAIFALVNSAASDFKDSLSGEIISELKEETVDTIFHYTDLMEQAGIIKKGGLYPLQLMYKILLNIEILIERKN